MDAERNRESREIVVEPSSHSVDNPEMVAVAEGLGDMKADVVERCSHKSRTAVIPHSRLLEGRTDG